MEDDLVVGHLQGSLDDDDSEEGGRDEQAKGRRVGWKKSAMSQPASPENTLQRSHTMFSVQSATEDMMVRTERKTVVQRLSNAVGRVRAQKISVRGSIKWFTGTQEDSDSDLSSEDDLDHWDPTQPQKIPHGNRHGRGKPQPKKLSPQDLLAYRGRALENLGVKEEPSPDDKILLRLQRKLGILELRIKIATKRVVVEEEPPKHPEIRSVVHSIRFEAFVGVLIMLNSVTIGAEAMYRPDEPKPSMLVVAEHLFTAIFLIEFWLRIAAYEWVWLFSWMNAFDTFIVWVTGVLVMWVFTPAGINISTLRRLAALRVLRLGRLCRAVRMIPAFHELWMLVNGVMECMYLLFWAMLIIGSVHFMFAVAILELVAGSDTFNNSDDPDLDAMVKFRFGNLSSAMFTLFQIMTFDSWGGIVRPIVKKMPISGLIFFLFIGIAGIVLMNLMTAIVVKNAFDAAQADEEAVAQLRQNEFLKTQRDLYEMFKDMDEDQSGELSREEFTDVLDDVLFVRKMKMLDIDLEELPDIFDILDDGDGQVSTEEFCTGLMRMQGPAMSREMLKATQRMKKLNVGFSKVEENLAHYAADTFEEVENSMDISHRNFIEIQQMTAEILNKINKIGIRRAVNASTRQLPGPPNEPSLQAALKAEKTAKRQEELAGVKRNAEISPADAASGSRMKPLPAAWLIKRKEEAKKKKAAGKKNTYTRKDTQERPPEATWVDTEGFQEQWDSLQVRPKTAPSAGEGEEASKGAEASAKGSDLRAAGDAAPGSAPQPPPGAPPAQRAAGSVPAPPPLHLPVQGIPSNLIVRKPNPSPDQDLDLPNAVPAEPPAETEASLV